MESPPRSALLSRAVRGTRLGVPPVDADYQAARYLRRSANLRVVRPDRSPASRLVCTRSGVLLRTVGGVALILAGACRRESANRPAQRAVEQPVPPTVGVIRRAGPVPATAPDTSPPQAFWDSLGTFGPGGGAARPWVRRVVDLVFRDGANRSARQAAVDAVGGAVIGGTRETGPDGDYYVLIPDTTRGGLMAAIRKLGALRQVEYAGPIVIDGSFMPVPRPKRRAARADKRESVKPHLDRLCLSRRSYRGHPSPA